MRFHSSTRLNLFAAAAIFAILFSGWVLFSGFNTVREQQQWVRHTHEVISQLDQLFGAAKDAESQVRGFILIGDAAYLEPYQRAVADIWDHFQKAKALSQDNPNQVAALNAIEVTLKSRLDLLEELQQARRASDSHALPNGNAYVQEGTASMESLRSQLEGMKAEENRLLQQRSDEARTGELTFRIFLILTTIFSLLIVTMAFIQGRRNFLRQEKETQEAATEAQRKSNIGEVARLVSGDIGSDEAARGILNFLAQIFNIPTLNFYELSAGSLQLVATHAGDSVPMQIEVGQGLVGQAFTKNEPTTVNEVPTGYFKIKSSIGEAMPTSLVLAPISFQGKNIAIIELATFEKLSEEKLHLLQELTNAAGVGMNAAQARQRQQELLEKTQQQAEELQAQQEELRTNNEELEEQARSLENQQQALNLRNRELESARIEIEQKAADLEKTSRYKSDFLAKMSHELRTPLNSLLILATLLLENREKNLSDKQLEFTRSIQAAGNDLLNLINDILDLSKIEAQKLALRPEKIQLNNLLRQMENTFGPQAQAKNLQLTIDVAPELEKAELVTDRQRLEQILRNLLSNALKFTEIGSIMLQARAVNDPSRLILSVRDTGVGIASDKRDLIFDAFEQADSSISRKYGGTGLGLTISRELAGLLGGFIRVESSEGKGSEFILNIPRILKTEELNLAPPKEVTAQPQPAAASSIDNVRPSDKDEIVNQAKDALKDLDPHAKTILIVEDDETFRHSIAEAASSFGFIPIEAGDGEVALAILDRHLPSAILLDIKLPGISGLGLLEMIKQSPQHRHLPIHMISALEYQQNALRLGAMGYLAKPVTVDKVKSALSRIEKVLSKKVKNLLIVEDDERQREAIRHLIEGADLEIQTVGTGHETLEAVKTRGFDCIILDLNLPDISGFELLDQLRALAVSLPPIVIYTGKDLSRQETDRLRMYSESIILKGAKSPERLLDEVNLFLHRVEALLPEEKKEMLHHLRQREQIFEGKTVLVVDDDLRNVFALTHALEERGFHVQVARDGVEALEWLEQNQDVDVVLMDIMMPRMDGFEATRRIRAMSQYRDLPIIALTAKAMKEDHEKCLEAGANDYLTKPINLNNLTSVLKVWLSPRNVFTQ